MTHPDDRVFQLSAVEGDYQQAPQVLLLACFLSRPIMPAINSHDSRVLVTSPVLKASAGSPIIPVHVRAEAQVMHARHEYPPSRGWDVGLPSS